MGIKLFKFEKIKKLFNFFNKQEKLNTDSEALDNSNTILSSMVNNKALIGNHITILNGSYVCQNTVIDSYNYIGLNTLISKTTIGRYNSIANNVNIGHGEHPLHLISTSSFISDTPYEVLTERPCIIEHDVWIGSGVTIRRGVTLGIGCVVGANAFVNQNVPPFAIVGGVPAKILKYRFSEDKINAILQSKWWELELNEAKLKVKQLEDNY